MYFRSSKRELKLCVKIIDQFLYYLYLSIFNHILERLMYNRLISYIHRIFTFAMGNGWKDPCFRHLSRWSLIPHTLKVIFKGSCLNRSATRNAIVKTPQSTKCGCCCCTGDTFTVIMGVFSISWAAICFFTLDVIRPLNMLVIEEGVEPMLDTNTQWFLS